MKKLSFILALVLTVSLLAVPAAAAEYKISDFGVSLTIPDDWFVLTADTPAGDPGYDYFGIDGAGFAEEMIPQGLYLHALSPDVKLNVRDEFKLSFSDTDSSERIFTYANLEPETLEAISLDYLNALEESSLSGFIRMSHGSYSANGINYGLVSYWLMRGDDYVNTRQYFTVYNGKMMTFTWDSFNEKAMEDDLAVIDGVLSSLKFEKTLRNPNAPMTKAELMRIIFIVLAAVALVAAVVCIIIDSARKKKLAAAEASADDECECDECACDKCQDECECQEECECECQEECECEECTDDSAPADEE